MVDRRISKNTPRSGQVTGCDSRNSRTADMDVAVSQAVSSLLQNTYSITVTAFWKNGLS
jgi:hypothetical protein